MSELDPDTLSHEHVAAVLGGLGLLAGDGQVRLPARMAPVDALMGALPGPLTERLLTEVLLGVVSAS